MHLMQSFTKNQKIIDSWKVGFAPYDNRDIISEFLFNYESFDYEKEVLFKSNSHFENKAVDFQKGLVEMEEVSQTLPLRRAS
jgi:hypothetical protein